MRQPPRELELLWMSGTRRCVLAMPDAVPQAYFVQVFDSAKVIFTQRCDTITDAVELGETLRQLNSVTVNAVTRARVF